MKASIKLKSVLATALDAAGISTRLIRRGSQGRVAILMYHRILPEDRISDSIQAGMVVEPDTLRLHVRYLKQHFEIISLDGLVANPDSVYARSRERPACVLTFDDGWRDFYDYAFPILHAEKAPATVFLPTSYIGTEKWFWTDRLGLMFADSQFDGRAANASISTEDSILKEILAPRGSIETRLERAIGLLKPLRIETIESVLEGLSSMLRLPHVPPCRAFLNWGEVQETFDSGLITYGSHTAWHPILTTLEDAEVTRELKESMEVLVSRGVANRESIAFCYPNGGTSERIERLVADAGYRIAVTTKRGWNERNADPYALSRIGVHQDITATQPMFASRLAAAF